MQTALAITIEKARKEHTIAIKQLLRESHLPTEDLTDELPHFLIATLDGRLVGCVGLEITSNQALLRSFAVEERFRNQQTGQKLYEAVIQLAEELSVASIYLITTTAEKYFEKQGFYKISRQQVPDAIRQTQQFSMICASTGIMMQKEL